MSAYWQAVRSFSPSLWRLFASLALIISVSMGLQAVLLNLYLLRLGFDAPYIGLLAGLGQLVWAAAALPAVLVSNRIGLRNSFQLSVALGGLGLAIILLVEFIARDYWQVWLLAGQVVMNIGLAIGTVNMPPYIMAVTSERERPHAFSFVAALIPFAALVGSLIGGILPGLLAERLGATLDQAEPYRLALWLGPFVCWLAILPLLGADPGNVHTPISTPIPSNSADEAPRAIDAGVHLHALASAGSTTRAPFGLLAFWGVFVFTAALGEGAVRTFFNVFLNTELGVSSAAIGLIMGAAQILPIVAALALPFALTTWGAGYTLIGGLVVMAACLAPLAVTGQIWVAAAAYTGAMVTFTVVGSSRDLFGQEMVIPRWRTSSQAVAIIGLGLGNSVAAVLGGLLIGVAGFGALYRFGTLAALLAAGLLFAYLYIAGRRRSRYVPGSSGVSAG